MLRKLFKYDFMAIGKTMWLFTILAVAACAIGCGVGVFMNNFDFESVSEYISISATIMAIFLLMICIYALLAYLVLAVIMILIRYYRNFFTDEGYLTFTLPVKSSTLLNAKILSSLLWSFISVAVAMISVFLIILFVAYNGNLNDMIESMSYTFPNLSFSSLMFDYYGMSPVITSILTTISGVIGIVYFIFVMFLSVTFASVVVKRARMVLGIVFYLGINSVVSVFMFIIVLILNIALVETDVPLMEAEQFTYLRYGIEYAIHGGIAVGAYFLNRYLLKNKLNLA